MKNSWIVAKRDMGSFFNSPIFYVVTTVFLILYSFIFINILNFFSMQSMQSGQFQQMGMGLNINEMVIEPSFQNMAVVLLLIIPIITMRSFAEEKKIKNLSPATFFTGAFKGNRFRKISCLHDSGDIDDSLVQLLCWIFILH